MKLDPLTAVNERTTLGFLSLFESLAALCLFLLIVVSPFMALANGNNYYISLFKNLYWVNKASNESLED